MDQAAHSTPALPPSCEVHCLHLPLACERLPCPGLERFAWDFTVTPLGLTIYGLAITFMGRQKQKNRWIPGAGIELTAIAMSIPVSYQLRYQIDFEISAG